MSKKKNPEINIYKAIRLNHLIVVLTIICSSITVIVVTMNANKRVAESSKQAIVLDNKGEVIPANWVDRIENIHIEIKDHLDRFHHYFYQYDGMSYKRNIEGHALWLADESVEQLYIKRTNDSWYDQVRQFQIRQTLFLEPENIQVVGEKEPYRFRVDAKLVIEQGTEKKVYHFTTTGNIIHVDQNYPLNSHGLLITNFIEKSKEELEQD